MYEELVKSLRTDHDKYFARDMEAADAIEELTDINVGKWIPVTEKLPVEKINPNTHDYEWVLCATIWGDVRPYKYGTTLNPKGLHFLHGGWIVDEYITHWMPLTEPPKEET